MAAASALERELREALLAEHGALALYRRLGPRVRDAQLARVLESFVEDERQQIEELGAMIRALGLRPVGASLRRRVLAELLAASAPLLGARLALRVCVDAEETRSRGYLHIAEYLRSHGERRCNGPLERMSRLKQQHAQVLGAWLQNAP